MTDEQFETIKRILIQIKAHLDAHDKHLESHDIHISLLEGCIREAFDMEPAPKKKDT